MSQVKRIVGVEYRHKLLTAYLKVWGRTEMSAERAARRIARWLQEELPDASVVALRPKGFDTVHEGYVTQIPIIIASCEGRAKAVINQMVLRGDLPS